MDYVKALATVNSMQDQLAGLAREVARALNDKRIGPLEGVTLGMRGMAFASAVIAMMQAGDSEAILYVLEHGEWVMPG